MAFALSGLWPPVATPFTADGAVDLPKLIAHSRQLLRDGSDGLAVLGTTSEANSLSLTERMAVIDAHVEAGIPGARLLPGVGSCAAGDVVALCRRASEIGAAGVLMLPPFYYKAITDDGLFAFYAKVIETLGARVPKILLYHIPQVSGVGLSLALVSRLRRAFPGVVVGIKDSSGNWDNTWALISENPDFAVLPGSEARLAEAMERGAAGCISASANVDAGLLATLARDWRAPGAAALAEEINAVRSALERRGLFPSVKAAIAARYRDDGWRALRPPMLPLASEAHDALLAEPAIQRLLAAPLP